MTSDKSVNQQPDTDRSSLGPSMTIIQKFLSGTMAVFAIILLFLAFQWLLADYTNLIDQTPRLHQELAELHADEDLRGRELELVSFGLQQQHFPQGVLAALLAVVLLYFSVQMLQPKPRQEVLLGLGALSLVLLVILVRFSDIWPLALVIAPVAIAMYLATEMVADDLLFEELESEVVGGSGEELDKAAPALFEGAVEEVSETEVSDAEVPEKDISVDDKNMEPSFAESQKEAINDHSVPSVPSVESEELDADSEEYEVPEIDELTITGLMNRPSVFEIYPDWESDIEPKEKKGLGDQLEDVAVVAEDNQISEREVSVTGIDAKASEESLSEVGASVFSEEVEAKEELLVVGGQEDAPMVEPVEGDIGESVEPDGQVLGYLESSPLIGPVVKGVSESESAGPDEVVQLEHGDLNFEIDGEVVAQLFGSSMDTLLSTEEAAFEAEVEEVGPQSLSDFDVTAYEPLASQEIQVLAEEGLLDDLFDDVVEEPIGQVAQADVSKSEYEGDDEISDVSDLIDEDLLSATGLFDPDQTLPGSGGSSR